jgi:hypothetical protein
MKSWEEGLQKEVAESLRNPTRPFNVHFYEARLNGRLRIFDLHRDKRGVTIGESLVRDTQPLMAPIVPPLVNAVYTHVNYGGLPDQDPGNIMYAFAHVHSLTDCKKIHEIQTLDQMMDIMGEVLLRLLINAELLT